MPRKIDPAFSWPASKVELRDIGKIIPYGDNPRTHPPGQITLIAASMKEDGVTAPILVDENGIILYGHGRRLAAIENGYTRYPVIVARGLSEAKKKALRVKDNSLALMSGWDRSLIVGEIASLKTSGYNIGLLGFGEAQLVQFETVPGPPAGGFPTFGENIPTEYCCPRCKFSWSGQPKPEAETPAPPKPAEKSTRAQRRAAAPK